jgi:lysophospholipase L1-like esterase
MRRLGLIAAGLACALAGVVVAKLHSRWAAMCANVPCSSLQTRLGVIGQMIAARPPGPSYLVIGDSLTEIGRWPAMCGREPVAAGISGARADTWLPHAKGIADALEPDFVVLALGTNDVLSQGRLGPYEQLASSLAGHRLVAVPVHGMPNAPEPAVREANARIARAVPRTAQGIVAATTDGIHLTAEDYARWLAAIERAACGGG